MLGLVTNDQTGAARPLQNTNGSPGTPGGTQTDTQHHNQSSLESLNPEVSKTEAAEAAKIFESTTPASFGYLATLKNPYVMTGLASAVFLCAATHISHRFLSDPAYKENKLSQGKFAKFKEIGLEECKDKNGNKFLVEVNVLEKGKIKTENFFQSKEGELYKDIKPSSLSTRAFFLVPKVAVYSAALILGNACTAAGKACKAVGAPKKIFTKENGKASAAQIWRVAKPVFYGSSMILASLLTMVMPLTGRVYLAQIETSWHENAEHSRWRDTKISSIIHWLERTQVSYIASDMLTIPNAQKTFIKDENKPKEKFKYHQWREVKAETKA